MIRSLLRFLGLLILAGGFLFFIYDGAKSLADNTIRMTTVGDAWTNFHQESLLALPAAIEGQVGSWLWKSALQPFLLEQPAWLVLAILGGILILLGRKKKPLIGYARD
jgi:hypothetical protein